MRRLLLILLLCARGAWAAIGLDATAHPSNAGNLTANADCCAAWGSLTTPTFSTGAGPIILVAIAHADGPGGTLPYSLSNTSGLTWTKRVDFTSTTVKGVQIWTAFSAAGSLSSQTVTLTAATNQINQAGYLGVIVLNGVPSTEAACIGASNGFIQTTAAAPQTTVTPNATGSWIIVGAGDTTSSTALTANTTTSAFDATQGEPTDGAWFAFGRYKVSGTVATTTAGVGVSVGASTSTSNPHVAALEILVATGAAAPPTRTLTGVGQ